MDEELKRAPAGHPPHSQPTWAPLLLPPCLPSGVASELSATFSMLPRPTKGLCRADLKNKTTQGRNEGRNERFPRRRATEECPLSMASCAWSWQGLLRADMPCVGEAGPLLSARLRKQQLLSTHASASGCLQIPPGCSRLPDALSGPRF